MATKLSKNYAQSDMLLRLIFKQHSQGVFLNGENSRKFKTDNRGGFGAHRNHIFYIADDRRLTLGGK